MARYKKLLGVKRTGTQAQLDKNKNESTKEAKRACTGAESNSLKVYAQIQSKSEHNSMHIDQ